MDKVIKISYRLDLLLKIKIHLIYYIAILKLVYGNYYYYYYYFLFKVWCGLLTSLYRLYIAMI